MIFFVAFVVVGILTKLISSYASHVRYEKLIDEHRERAWQQQQREWVWQKEQRERLRREEQREHVRQQEQEQLERAWRREEEERQRVLQQKLEELKEELERLQQELELLQQHEQEQLELTRQHEQDISFYMGAAWIPEEVSGEVNDFITPWMSASGHITVRFLRTHSGTYYVVVENCERKNPAKPPSRNAVGVLTIY